MKNSRSLFGSKRSRFFQEPKSRGGKSFSYKRKQRVKFRSRYAGSVAKQWSKTIVNTTVGCGIAAGALWGSVAFANVWKTSETLRVREIVFSGDLPDRLRASFPVKPNDHLLKISTAEIELNTLIKFPELEKFSVGRGLNRTLTVKGKYRTPVAMTHAQGEERAMDHSGTLFRLPETMHPQKPLPWVETASIENRKLLLSYLSTWEEDAPDFYSLVKKIETDRMRELYVELSDGVLINWGPMEESDILNKADKIIRFREMFQPVKTPANLMFVTSDRIVMDKNWQKK